MAKITLDNVQHSYFPEPKGRSDYALHDINFDCEDGGAYALLGPSGCGKSTLLNIISGLVRPTAGRIFFDDEDVTNFATDQRHIAQVFQFPVIYDTMTVYDNLAFPLRNKRIDEGKIARRVDEIATMLELHDLLQKRASGLSPDNKQKISMGRGLVRDDCRVVMFDEPLTVIDPHLKWTLRSKLKELQQRIRTTMIYVTHDQTEALTFADQVVVMQHGEVVQIGSPIELFERPQHTFVGHFIGSPGMNLLPCTVDAGKAIFQGTAIETSGKLPALVGGKTVLGIRPEFVRIGDQDSAEGLKARVIRIADIGRHHLVELMLGGEKIAAVVTDGHIPILQAEVRVQFLPEQTRLYSDGWLVRAS